MLGLAEVFSKQAELINFAGKYENEFETIKLLHTLPAEQRKYFNALSTQLLENLQPTQDKQKCGERARRLREEGNSVYKSKSGRKDAELADCLLGACRLYTQAILAAENARQELCLGYANRGMALQDFGYYAQAYDDCACALEYGYPEQLQHKLLMRQAHCAWKLNDARLLQQHLSSLRQVRAALNAGYRQQLEQLQQQLELLQRELPQQQQLPAEVTPLPAEQKYEIVAQAQLGRHMLARQQIAAQELIFTEQADCFVPIEQRLICQACAASLLCAPIPCPECGQRVVYCSRRCRAAHAHIHQHECAAYSRGLLAMLGVSHLALRLLLRYLPQWLQQLAPAATAEQLWLQLMALAAEWRHEQAAASQALQTLCMISHLDKLPAEELLYHTLCANLLQVYLHNCSGFYAQLSRCAPALHAEHWHPLLAALLLRCAGQLLVNGHAADAMLPCALPGNEFALLQPALWQRPLRLRLGCLHSFAHSTLVAAINLPRLSLCNHACAASIRSHYDGCTVRNYAAQQIAAGEQIFNCYTMDCRQTLRAQRRQQLQDIYKFHCRCAKCQRAAPDQDYLAFHRYRCERSACGSSFTPAPLPQQTSLSWWLQPAQLTHIRCTVCGAVQLSAWYERFQQLLERCTQPAVRRELYENFKALDKWLLDYHSLKLSLARQLIAGCFEHRAALSDCDYAQLAPIIRFQLAGLAAQCGSSSMEYLTQMTYYWDLLALGKHKCSLQQLRHMRSAVEFLARETRQIFVNYYNDFIEQQYK
ncbi:hypothetical protein KR222_011041 [Zaprionus bogoriensis]|nr:hypothetical protein KR222_011041 [Zaprionus bogoriensis]